MNKNFWSREILMKRPLQLSLVAAIFGVSPTIAADKVEVMTLNQYIGGDLSSLVAGPAGNLNTALVALLEDIAATDFPARAQRQASLIARNRPDLVGLQEVWDLSCVDLDPPEPGEGCDHPSIAGAFVDHLDVTLDALMDLGAGYETVATVRNVDLTTATLTLPDGTVINLGGIPFQIDGVRVLLTSSDRDVILARTSTVVDPVPVSFGIPCLVSQDGCNYHVDAPVEFSTPSGLLQFSLKRGFVAVDATVEGREYRFVNTHLEIPEPAPGNPLSRFIQAAQAAELIQTLEVTTPPWISLILAGDMNSSPEDDPVPGPLPLPPPFDAGIVPPYAQLVDAGYTDIWTLRPGAVPGFTCCQDADLRNRRSTLSERIDLIFSLEVPAALRQARVVGGNVSDKTHPPGLGLWPSDHAGVVAKLLFSWPSIARRS